MRLRGRGRTVHPAPPVAAWRPRETRASSVRQLRLWRKRCRCRMSARTASLVCNSGLPVEPIKWLRRQSQTRCCAIWLAKGFWIMRDDREDLWLPATEIERTLDRVIDGLASMDAEILMQLASLCRDWEAKGRPLYVSNATHARLSWKLLLLDRLLRQTRINLNVLGLEPRQYSLANGYRSPARR